MLAEPLPLSGPSSPSPGARASPDCSGECHRKCSGVRRPSPGGPSRSPPSLPDLMLPLPFPAFPPLSSSLCLLATAASRPTIREGSFPGFHLLPFLSSAVLPERWDRFSLPPRQWRSSRCSEEERKQSQKEGQVDCHSAPDCSEAVLLCLSLKRKGVSFPREVAEGHHCVKADPFLGKVAPVSSQQTRRPWARE